MIPPAFDYHAPASLPEAIALLSRFGDSAKVISGGQSLLPLLKLRLGTAEHLVDIGRISGLEYVREEGGFLRIGGRTRESVLERSELVQSRYPILADTTRVIADPLVRKRATGGAYLKLERKVGDYATAAAAAQVTLDGSGAFAQVGLALTNAGPMPARARDAEQYLTGRRANDAAIAEAARRAAEASSPSADRR